MAPFATSFAASFAATVAVGVGVALARAERERRAARRRHDAERQFALLPGELPVNGLKRMALGQLDLAIDLLGANGAPDEKAVHETRKALKRLRALLRLLRQQLGEEVYARESAALRDVGRRLAGARDAEVMVSTLEKLIERHPRRLGRRRGVARLRKVLLAERNTASARVLGDWALRAEVLDDLRSVRYRVAGWQLDGPVGVAAVEHDLRRLYGQGRERLERAERGRGDRGRALHEWRKRVKDLRYATEMLQQRDPVAQRAHGRRGRRRRRRERQQEGARFIHRLARSADSLGEALGEEHDLAVLAERIAGRGEHGGPHGSGERVRLGRGSRRALLKAIARRRRRLRARTLRDGARLYKRRPKLFVRRVRSAYERASVSRR